jgi:hypothetical protein
MSSLNSVLFPHRTNEDGSYDSICRICHLTVGSASIERELARSEREHACDPNRIYQLTEDSRVQRESVDEFKQTKVGWVTLGVLRGGSQTGIEGVGK